MITSACSDGNDNGADSTQPPTAQLQGFTLSEFSTPVEVVEGEQASMTTVTVARGADFQGDIQLRIPPSFLTANPKLSVNLEPATLVSGTNSAQLTLSYALSTAPQQPTTVDMPIEAVSGDITQTANLTLEISPTAAPDVYLLIGQSNMTGDSEPGSLQNQPGQPDAPDARINQLNVTNNDAATFNSQASFSDAANNVGSPAIITAADPLHELLPTGQASKSGNQIGLGLSFAKAALPDTTSTILLVPAAFGGTGFCNNPANLTGWNAEPRENERMRATGLYERAVTRANLALQQSGGILRGILWHQGESDEFNAECANAYPQNLQTMVSSLRTDIAEDARGNAARGPDSDVPFVLGTLSRGVDNRGNFTIQTPEQQAIDNAHRSVQNIIPNSAFSDHQDLVPPAFPCGDDSCIHFGAAAYREMGSRYNQALRDILAR